MIEHLKKFLFCTEYFRNNLDKYKDAFIKFYGEAERERIEEVFNHAIFIAYRTPSSTDTLLRELEKLKTKEIIDNNLPKDSTFTSEDLIGNYAFDFSDLIPICKYSEFYELYKLSSEERHEKYLKDSYESLKRALPELKYEEYLEMYNSGKVSEKYSVIRSWVKANIEHCINPETEKKQYERAFDNAQELITKIDKDITIDNFPYYADNPRILELNEFAEKLPEMMDEYQKFENELGDIREEVESEKEEERKLEAKYYIQLISENLDLVPANYLEKLKSTLAKKDTLNIDYEVKSIFGYSIDITGSYEMFSKESNEVLNENKDSWKANTIKSNRISYFKAHGIDLGDDYEVYARSEAAKSIWPKEERIAKFIQDKESLINKKNNEFYTNIRTHKAIRSEIDSLSLLDKEDTFNAALYTQGGTHVNPNIRKTESGYELYSLVVINCENDNGYVDHDIIHELNHLYELYLINAEDNKYTISCGWDVMESRFNQDSKKEIDTLHKDTEKRPYELFNEIINEMIAQEIVEGMHEDGVYVFDRPEKAKTRYVTGYDKTKILVADFFNKYRDLIFESRKNNNMQVLFDEVGKENFDKLNSLFAIFNENFSEFKYYNLLDSIKKEEDTPQTRLYFDLIRQRDEILRKMEEYKMLNEQDKKEDKSSSSSKK